MTYYADETVQTGLMASTLSSVNYRVYASWLVCVIFLSAWVLVGCSPYPTKARLLKIAEQERYDPGTMELEDGYNSFVKNIMLCDAKVETGIVSLKDGASAKFWFRSHHLAKDIGGTWFFMSDGSRAYMAGYFCCEALFPEEGFASLDELKTYISGHNGDIP